MSPDHGFHPLAVKRIVQETHDTKSFVFDVPPDLRPAFVYEAGQFCTFRIPFGDEELLRCYSMSSSPATDTELTLTVKRVAGGRVSNWMLDRVGEGDVLALTRPAGVFTLRPRTTPIVAFAGGSGITPVFSLVKSTLATTDRRVRLLYANRDAASVIFRAELDDLERAHPDRLQVDHHLDTEHGFVHSNGVTRLRRRRARRRLLHLWSGPVHGRRGGRARASRGVVGPGVHRAVRVRVDRAARRTTGDAGAAPPTAPARRSRS